jgi:hypothetical protein
VGQALSPARRMNRRLNRHLNKGSAVLTALCLTLRSPRTASAASPQTPATPRRPPHPAPPTPSRPHRPPSPPPPTRCSQRAEQRAEQRAHAPAAKPELSESDTLVARAGLDIDTADAGPSGPIIVSRMDELGNLELRRAEILPSRLGNDPVIRIRVSLQPGASDVFLIRSDVAVRGQSLEGSSHDVLCSLCTESEVVERARAEIVRLVPYVRAQFRAPPPKPDPTPDPTPVTPQGPVPLATMGKAGVGLLAGGTVATAAGLGLSLAEEPADPDMPLNTIKFNPAGYAVLAVGAAALVTGAVLLILDRRQAKRAVQVAPTAAPATAGLVLFGRF